MRRIPKTLYTLGILIGISLLIQQVIQGYRAFTLKSVQIVSPFLLVSAFGIAFVAIMIQILNWMNLMRGVGTRISWLHSVKGYVISFIPRYIPGSIWGYFTRNEWLYQTLKLPFSTSNLISGFELIGIFTSIVLLIGLQSIHISSNIHKIGLLVLFILTPILLWILFYRALRITTISRFFPGISPLSLKSNSVFGRWFIACFFYLVNWFLYGSVLFLILQALDLKTNLQSFMQLVTLSTTFAVSWMMGFIIPFLPSGLGLRELILASLLTIMLNLTTGQGSVVAILVRLVAASAELSWVGMGLLVRVTKFTVKTD